MSDKEKDEAKQLARVTRKGHPFGKNRRKREFAQRLRKTRVAELMRQGKTVAEAAKELDVVESCVDSDIADNRTVGEALDLRMHKVAELAIEGMNLSDIGRKLGVSVSAVVEDMKRYSEGLDYTRAMTQKAADDYRKRKLQERIDWVRNEAITLHERAKEERVFKHIRQIPGPDGPDGKKTSTQLVDAKVEVHIDSRHLAVVMSTIDREARLWGLDAPAKVANTDPDGGPIGLPISKVEVTIIDPKPEPKE